MTMLPGNLLVAPGSLFCIDWEFATLGPVAFDVGCLLGNLVLCMLWLQALDEVEASERSSKQQQQQQRGSTRQQQAAWLLEVLKETWELFVVEYPQRRAAAAAPAGSGCGMSSACELWAQVLDGESAATGLPPLPAPTLPDDWQQQLLLDRCVNTIIFHYILIKKIQVQVVSIPLPPLLTLIMCSAWHRSRPTSVLPHIPPLQDVPVHLTAPPVTSLLRMCVSLRLSLTYPLSLPTCAIAVLATRVAASCD